MGLWECFIWGLFGGFLSEILGLFKLRQQLAKEFPMWLKSPIYWVITIGMILVGGILVIVYEQSDQILSPIMAVNIGASAPLIIGSLVAQTPPVTKVN